MISIHCKKVLAADVPEVAAVGELFLTTDSFEAFAGTGEGIAQWRIGPAKVRAILDQKFSRESIN